MCVANIRDSEHGKVIAIPKDEMKYESKLSDNDLQKTRDYKSKMSATSFEPKDNNSMEAVSITTHVDEMVSVTENVLDAALENFNEWYDDICKNGIPIKADIFETIENDAKELAKVRSISTQSSKQHENIQEEEVKSHEEEVKSQEEEVKSQEEEVKNQEEEMKFQEEEVKSQKEQCRIKFGFKRSRRFLVLLLVSTTFCVMPDVRTKHSLQTFPTNPSVQLRPTSNMFEPKAPKKAGILSTLREVFPLRDNLGNGSCFVGVEC